MAKKNIEVAKELDIDYSLVDEFAESAFSSMGIQVSPEIAKTYNRFKSLKDKLQPGRMKPADFAVCVMLSERSE